MRYQSNRSTSIVRAAAVAAVALFATSAGAVAETQLKGQWNGTSQLRGESSTAKTFLSLGAPDDESATLRLEGRTNCSLRDGKYSADGNGVWNLSFKQASGGDACRRLAQGKFTLHESASSKQILLDVSYPSANGEQNQRHGALNRYP